MCTALFYYTCVYIYSLLNSCGYWTLNKYYCYYYLYYLCIIYVLKKFRENLRPNSLRCTIDMKSGREYAPLPLNIVHSNTLSIIFI